MTANAFFGRRRKLFVFPLENPLSVVLLLKEKGAFLLYRTMTDQEFWAQYGQGLNAKQRAAVSQITGADLLLAVPGSGKTTVLVHRVGYMVLVGGVEPEHILTMTYTVAATDDMRERCAAIFGHELADRVNFGTINAVALEVIRYFGEVTGREAPPLYPDERLVGGIVAGLLRRQGNYFPTEYDLRLARTAITYVKNQMRNHGEYRTVEAGEIDVEALMDGYEEAMREAGWMDFDDQLVYAHRILSHYPAVQAYFAAKYTHILVDEAQDTSKIQHAIIRLLAGDKPNLFMVGDEDQSIYGFRAAYPEALMDFTKDYEGATVAYLDQNYRSTQGIVEIAQRFVGKNVNRRPKRMVAVRDVAGGVERVQLGTRSDQYDYLVKVAAAVPRDTAVLYRDNECAIPLIQRLFKQDIPFRGVGFNMASFFDHRSVRDALDIMEFAFFPRDRERFMRIYSRLGCRIKREDADYACKQAAGTGTPILNVLLRRYKSQYAKAADVLSAVDALIAISKCGTAEDALAILVEHFCRAGSTWLSPNKQYILSSLSEGTNVHPMAFRTHLKSLAAKIDGHVNPPLGIILSTVHSAKGLEYDDVYLIDVVNGVFNARQRREEQEGDPEEDRRLFYVAMTRAKNHLYVLSYRDHSSDYASELFGKMLAPKPKADSRLADWCETHKAGHYVRHRKYGLLRIVAVDQGAEDATVTLDVAGAPKKFSLKALLDNKIISDE